jgi:DNA-binding NarL/FixJ family response regulator
MSQPVRVLIADKDVAFSKGLQEFLEQQADMTVVDVVLDGQGAVNACKETLPNIVLMDLRLPVLDSIRSIRTILNQNVHMRILVMSSISDDRYAVEAVKVGACGYIEKNGEMTYNEIVRAIRQVMNGEVFLSPGLASGILREFHRFSK